MLAWSDHRDGRLWHTLLLTCLAMPLILAGICARSAATGAAAVDPTPEWVTYTAGGDVADIEPEAVADGYLLWVATSGGVHVWEDRGETWGITRILTTADGLPSNNVRDIAIDAQGNKWIGTDKGVGSALLRRAGGYPPEPTRSAMVWLPTLCTRS